MELEGLKRGMAFLTENDLTTDVLITDRHVSIQKWMRESMPEVKHFYDVWHVAKGYSKLIF